MLKSITATLLLCYIASSEADISEVEQSGAQLERCTITQEQKLYDNYLAGKYSERNSKLYKPLLKAVQEYQDGKLQIVDVRESQKYTEFRIPGSLNIPLSMIEHKKFLKNKNLLILNEGTQFIHLEETVKTLRKKGFSKVFLLDGGIRRWASKTSYVDGKYSSKNYNALSVKDFLAESKLGPWLVIELGEKGSFKEEVNGKVINLKVDDTFLLNFSSVLSEHGSDLTRVVFVSDDKVNVKKLENYLSKSDFNNLYILRKTVDYIPVYKKESLIAFQKRNKPSLVECLIE